VLVAAGFPLISHRFQEQILSSRILVFNDDQVYFKCHNCVWSENSRAETTPTICTLLGSSDSPTNLDLKSSGWSLYPDYVGEYSSRQLSYESDAINAMTGILNRISIAMGCRFLHGLPTEAFDISLMFVPKLFQRRHGFPSYSWAGWKGTKYVEPLNMYLTDPRLQSELEEEPDGEGWIEVFTRNSKKVVALNTWIVWYESPASESPRFVSIHEDRNDRQADIARRKRRLFESPKGVQIGGDVSQTAPNQDVSPLKLPTYSVLQFWTVSVMLVLEKHPVPSTDRANIVDRNNKYCGQMFLPRGYEPEYGKPNEFLILSTTNMSQSLTGVFSIDASGRNSEPINLFRVMLITWTDGVAERVTIGEIERRALRKACPPGPMWKEIVLG
jgi:hypothetical protein